MRVGFSDSSSEHNHSNIALSTRRGVFQAAGEAETSLASRQLTARNRLALTPKVLPCRPWPVNNPMPSTTLSSIFNVKPNLEPARPLLLKLTFYLFAHRHWSTCIFPWSEQYRARHRPQTAMAEYTMEDTQNSAPGEPTLHETSKLSAPRRQDAQSVTKRYAFPFIQQTRVSHR